MTLARSLETLAELGVTIDLVRTQRDLAVAALKNISQVDTLEEARSIARGVTAAIEVCEDETIVITTRDYTAAVEEGDTAE